MVMTLFRIFTIISCLFLILVLFNKESIMADGLRGLWENIKSRLPDMQSLYRESNKRSWSDNKEISSLLKDRPILARIIQTESSNNPDAVSPKGAAGLMQVMPDTGMQPGFGVTETLVDKDKQGNIIRDDRLDPVKNVKFGAQYFDGLTKAFGNERNALIAYNWGAGNTRKWLKDGGDLNKLPKETQVYLRKILGEESLMVEPMTMASLQDEPIALSNKGGMVYRNYHKYKPRAI